MKVRKSTKALSIFLVLFLVISIFPMNLFAKTDSSYLDKIEKSLQKVPASKEVEFIVTLKAEADLTKVKPEDVVDTLRDTSEKSQESLISFVERKVKDGDISEYNSFFIINSIYIKGKAELIEKIARRSDVESIRLNHTIVSDKEEIVKRKSSLSEVTSYVPWNLESIQADRVTKTGKDIVVGIIDSGVNANHPELQNALLPGGFKDFVEPSNTEPKDETGHGTHVAGTILGRTIGIARDAKLIVARVFNKEGEASDEGLLAAGQWILEKKPQVVNNSWGGNRDDSFYDDIVKKWKAAGIVPIFSSGNTGEYNAGGEGSIGSPGSLEDSFSVGALTKDDRLAKFSLRGPSKHTNKFKPEISAPGVNILSADYKGGYVLKTGTSMAAPHVSGAVALILEANRNLTVDKVEQILKSTATPLTDDHYISSPNMGYGYGKLNVFKAVEAALGKDVDKFATFTGQTLISGTDNVLPAIEATTPKKLYNTYDFEFEAKVSDNVGVKSVTLYYKSGVTETFTSKSFELYSGNKKSGTYTVTIHPSDLPVGNASYYIEAVDYSGNIYKTDTIQATVETGIKPGYSNDFENGADGFVFGGKTPMWEVGVPTYGPTSAPSGSNVVGTRLKGKYDGLINSLLISPPIDLSDVNTDVDLSFKDWSELDNYMGGFEDTAEVWIGEINENDSSVDKISYPKEPALVNRYSKRTWEERHIDLSPYKGKKIIVMFALRWSGYSKRDAAGYYIDDFKLEGLSGKAPLPPSKGLSAENYVGSGKVRVHFEKINDPAITKYALYRSKTKDSQYEKVKEQKLSAYATHIEDIPLPQEGSYYYKVASIKGSVESALSEAVSVTFTKGDKFKFYDFESGEQGWTSPSEAKWERGETSDDYSDGPTTYSSKTKNTNSPNVFMTGLNKNALGGKTYELVSPVIDLSGLTKANLYYQNWYNFSSDTSDTYEIWFKNAEGTWDKVFSLGENMDNLNINGHKRSRYSWVIDGIAIDSKYLTKNFQMKFKLTTAKYSSDPGWYIDDVAIFNAANVAETSTANELQAINEKASTTTNTANAINEETAYNAGGEYASDETIKNPETITPIDISGERFTLLGTKFYEVGEDAPVTSTIPSAAIVKILETNTYVRSEAGSGRFLIKHPAGTYTVVAYNENYKSKPVKITLKEGEVLEQDILMDSLETYGLSFDIKDNEGNSVKSDVKIYEKGSNIPKYISSSKSTVILTNIPEGEYKVIVLASGYRTYEKMVTIKDNTSLSTIVLTKLTTSGEKKEVANDSGDFAKAKILAPLKNGGSVAVKYHFDEEVILKKLRIGLKKATAESIVGKSFTYSIYGENDKDGYPGNILLGPVTTTVALDNDFTDIVIPDLFVKGDIYVAYTQVGEGDTVPRIAVDESTRGDGKIFKLINGAWYEAGELGMYMVRIETEEVSSAKQPETPPVTPPTPSIPETPPTPSYNPGYSYIPPVSVAPSGEKARENKDDKAVNKLKEMEDKLEKQISIIDEKSTPLGAFDKRLKVLEKIEKKLKALENIEKKLNALDKKAKKKDIKTFIKKAYKKLKINLGSFKVTKDTEHIKISIKGLKEGRDYEVFFRKMKDKIKIIILGKGRYKGRYTKSVSIKK